jgi:hypothetical protein
VNIQHELSKAWRLGTAPLRALPNFLIPGAPKCATSSVYDLIALHPEVRRSWRKEPTNFVHYGKSTLHARMNHPLRFGRFLCGDASVEYFFHPEAAANAAAVVPDAKVVFVLRDPVGRAWSDYRMFVKSGHEKESFPAAVERAIGWLSDPETLPLCGEVSRRAYNPVRYVRCGQYEENISRWHRHFDRDQILIVFAEDYFSRPAAFATRVYKFLGLSEFSPSTFPHARNSGSDSEPEAETAAKLRAFFEDGDAKLRQFVGTPLPWDHA